MAVRLVDRNGRETPGALFARADPRARRHRARHDRRVPRREPDPRHGPAAHLAGEPRRADRARQPARVRAAARRADRDREGAGPRARAPVHGPRQLQGGQRHLRPQRRRRAAAPADLGHACRACAAATRSRGWAATSSARCSSPARSTRRCASPTRCARRCASSASCGRTRRSASASAWAWCRSTRRAATSASVLAIADACCYEAKNKGRDRVQVYRPERGRLRRRSTRSCRSSRRSTTPSSWASSGSTASASRRSTRPRAASRTTRCWCACSTAPATWSRPPASCPPRSATTCSRRSSAG